MIGSVIISECFSRGTVSAKNYSGGLIGAMAWGDVNYCYSTSDVSSNTYSLPSCMGGLIGHLGLWVNVGYCYALGDVVINGQTTGGLIGVKGSNCYVGTSLYKSKKSDGTDNANNDGTIIGSGYIIDDLKLFDTYDSNGWIFGIKSSGEKWNQDASENNSFPFLNNNPPPPQ